MNETLRFQTNLPQEVALAFPEGKPVEGQYGAQVMFTLAEPANTRMYVPPVVADRIRELHVVPNQRIAVVKAEVQKGQRKAIQWEVKLVDPAPEAAVREMPVSSAAARQDAQSIQPNSSRSGHGELAVPRVMPMNYKPNGNGANGHGAVNGSNGHATLNGIPYFDPKTELLNCYRDAIEVLTEARNEAAAKGLPVQFTGEDLRQVAATLYIDAGKNRRTPWPHQVA